MSVEYSTMPLALRGARLMSAITALRGSCRIDFAERAPDGFSYWPTSPNDAPSKVGDSMRVIDEAGNVCLGDGSSNRR